MRFWGQHFLSEHNNTHHNKNMKTTVCSGFQWSKFPLTGPFHSLWRQWSLTAHVRGTSRLTSSNSFVNKSKITLSLTPMYRLPVSLWHTRQLSPMRPCAVHNLSVSQFSPSFFCSQILFDKCFLFTPKKIVKKTELMGHDISISGNEKV